MEVYIVHMTDNYTLEKDMEVFGSLESAIEVAVKSSDIPNIRHLLQFNLWDNKNDTFGLEVVRFASEYTDDDLDEEVIETIHILKATVK